MNVPVEQDPRPLNTFSSTAQPTALSGARRGRRWVAGGGGGGCVGGAEGEAVGLPPRPGQDRGLRPGERTLDLDSVTED